MGSRRPRVLVTGFEPFPGARVNPTEALVQRWQAEPPVFADAEAFRSELLPVDYASIGSRLSQIGLEFAPDIAVHFGLAGSCGGFRLERIARNRFDSARPDNRGDAPVDGEICVAAPLLTPTLPLQAIHDALMAQALPVEWSDDAGGYLCNMAMTLSLAHACQGFAPAMSGFIHVPPVGEGLPLTMPQLEKGARIIVKTCLKAWSAA